ncbi:TVP38/TMEM64 family protein [Metabacillus litoralis]|uniref:TVP38/TMEM64 family membrane protein n=1 Tax=Metabacillus litoralis TaxID=152268 RepID=A0A5C6W930_9BACI|nr:TVP38/TMEM64 family protein [Metabacillus litoralis]TXC92948.1 TVP38/TMEM64 family protein [Metabacillus litoralis]
MKKKRSISIGLLIIFIPTFYYLNQHVIDFSPEIIKQWILSIGVLAPIIYIGLYSVRPFILFPSSVLSLAGGLAFGPFYGTLLTIIGATIGAYFAFLLSRKVGGRWIEKKSGARIEKVKNLLEKNGFVSVLLVRLLPIFPFDLVSYAAGLSKVRTSHFVLATIVGIIPGTFAYNFLGASATSNNLLTIIMAITLFLLVMVTPALFKNKFKNFLDKQETK